MENNENKVLKALKWFFTSFIWLAIIMFVIDIVTKQAVISYFKTHDEPIVLIPGFLQINYTLNEAAAFGIGFDNATVNRVIYIIVALLGLGAIITYYVIRYKKLDKYTRAVLMLIAAGALGNLIDRIFYSSSFESTLIWSNKNGGLVVDWIDFCGIWKFIFNIADSCVVIGVIMMIVYLIVDEVKTMKEKRKQEIASNNNEKVLSKEEKSRLENEETKEAKTDKE